MIKTIFRGADLPPQERLARFDEFQATSCHAMRVRSDESANFQVTARELDLGAVNVVELNCSPSDVRRTPRLIRASDPELFSVVVALRGEVAVTQCGREALLSPNSIAAYDSSRPCNIRIASSATLVRAHVPRTFLPLPADRADRLLAVPLSGQEGVGALFTQFVTSLTTDSASYRPTDAPRLNTVALSLLTAMLAHHLDADEQVPPDMRTSTLFLRVQAHIQQRLHDPQLGPGDIAAAHHISVRYLHRLFQSKGTTVSIWIRRQRLEQARRDLTDPAMRSMPVHRIAFRWGFKDHATFTRAFREAYALPPRDYRQWAALASACCEDRT